MNNLGMMCYRGEGASKNFGEAAQCYHMAAAGGHAAAMRNLGTMHLRGDGVSQNRTKAYVWLCMAEAHGDEEAATLRERLEREISADEIAEARKWLRKREPLAE
jgi:hypothetical protein